MLVGRNPFIKEKVEEVKAPEKAKDVLEGLVEEIRALYKMVAPIKETYAKRLKKDLPSLSSLPSSVLPPFTSTPSPFSRSFISTRSKKKAATRKEASLNYGLKGLIFRYFLYTK